MLAEVAALNNEAVMRPTLCESHNLHLDCCLVSCSNAIACSKVTYKTQIQCVK